MAKFIAGRVNDDLTVALCESVGLDPRSVRRIVVDLEVNSVARIYFDTFLETEVADLLRVGLNLEALEAA